MIMDESDNGWGEEMAKGSEEWKGKGVVIIIYNGKK